MNLPRLIPIALVTAFILASVFACVSGYQDDGITLCGTDCAGRK
jgi:hypothetical protein